MLGKGDNNIGGSEFLKIVHGIVQGPLSPVDWNIEKRLNKFIMDNIALFCSLHDISDGGLAVALFESAYYGKTGINVNINTGSDIERFMFSETSGRIIFDADDKNFDIIREKAFDYNIPFTELGVSQSSIFKLNDFEFKMKELCEIFERGIL
jgi:phosphoribosylformylglycinamidine synthase